MKNKRICLKIETEVYENQIKARAREMSEPVSVYIRRLCFQDFQNNKLSLFQSEEKESSKPNFNIQKEIYETLKQRKSKLK